MPIDDLDLTRALAEAYDAYLKDPVRAVRSKGFIAKIHDYCSRELHRKGIPKDNLIPHPDAGGYLRPTVESVLDSVSQRIRAGLRKNEYAQARAELEEAVEKVRNQSRAKLVRVEGGYLRKEIDVCYMLEDTGPILALSVKSQMSSIGKNVINRFEEYVGDATNLHSRYPMLVLGFLIIIPVADETFSDSGPTPVSTRILNLLSQATGRHSSTDQPGNYEAATLLAVDFNVSPPRIRKDFPPSESGLRVEDFFDRLTMIVRQRNHNLLP